MRVAFLLVVMAGLNFGCGQKGDLYLRDSPPPGIKPPKPATTKPVPYPQPVGDQTDAEKKP